MHVRRRAGLSSLPVLPPSGWLVQSEAGNGLPKPGIFKLQLLQPLHLIQLQAAIFLPPRVVGHLGHPNLSNRIGHRGPLLNKDIDLPQFGEDLQACAFSLACSDPP